jgi:hypothetical protein
MLEIIRFKVIGFSYQSQPGDRGFVRISYDYLTSSGLSKGSKPLDIEVRDENKQALEDLITKMEEIVTNFEENDEIEKEESPPNKLKVCPPPDWLEQMTKLKGAVFVKRITDNFE